VLAQDDRVDVLVVGGGTAGVVAAIQAARAGARTMLVERGPQLGGTMTTGGVSFPGLFDAWGKQVIAGIGWELVTATVALDGGELPDFEDDYGREHWRHHVRLNGPVYASVAEERCLQANVKLAYYELAVSAEHRNDGWLVRTVGKGLRREIRCRQLIDCTGDADIVAMAGYERVKGETLQPGTLMMKLVGFDVDALDEADIQTRYEEALAAGALRPGDYQHKTRPFTHFLRNGGANAQHVFGADSSTSATQTQANIAGRASMLRLLRFVRSLPGCEHTRIQYLAAETAVRESYRIVGEIVVTHDDYVTGRAFEDAIGYSYYPIDVHDEDGVEPRHLQRGVIPTIPLRALVPKSSRDLLVAGRCISSDRQANSALRVQASCMAMGQGAAAAAVLAAQGRCSPLGVPFEELKSLLRSQGALVP